MHQGAWLKLEISRQKQTVRGFAARVGINKSSLFNWYKMPEIRMRSDVMWAVIDGLGLAKAAEELGHVRAGASSDPLVEQGRASHVFGDMIRAQIAGTLGTPQSRPLHPSGVGARTSRGVEPESMTDVGRPLEEIPFFDLSLAAGPFTDVSEVSEIVGPASVRQGIFRVRISGDSMSPVYRSGIVVEFQFCRGGIAREHIGKDVYVQMVDGTATFKRLEDFDADELFLRPLNRKKYKHRMAIDRSAVERFAVAKAVVQLL